MRLDIVVLLIGFTVMSTAAVQAGEVNFESPPVHPVELSADGSQLYVAHTADHRLVTFSLAGPAPVVISEVMVGLEPVTVRSRTATEVWVVNHVSDSISVVDVSTGNVLGTLNVGDEPTDVVFTGGRAFVCVSQEDLLRVYDLANLDAPPVDILLSMSDPRSLAVSNDGNTVYVSALDSQNQTTVIGNDTVWSNGGLPSPNPPMAGGLPAAPQVGLIVRHDGANWVDDAGGNWSGVVPYTMPDHDVLGFDATTFGVVATFTGVGTTLFNLAVHPNDDLYVTNQEAFNEIRFEPNLKGSFAQNRVTRISPGGSVAAHHLNAHINYADAAGTANERALSISTPLDLEIASSGNEIYVTGFGSRKIAVLDAAGNVTRRIDVGEGPAGLALDEARNRLYVYNRFASTLSDVDLSDDTSAEVPLGFDPSTPEVLEGRKFLYDGEVSSAHGDLSCATCHLFGGMDNLGWDLGDPAGDLIPVPPGQVVPLPPFHPMKGPMTTQSLKGLTATEPLHWRGDRATFADFNPAFVGLMGRSTELDAADFQRFEDFVFAMEYPSNPFLELDGTFAPDLNGADPANGESLFLTAELVGNLDCVSCHALPAGQSAAIIPGFALQEPEAKVVPQLRNMYEKTRFDATASTTVRGFGFISNGSVPDLFEFLEFSAFEFTSDDDQRDVEAYLLSFPTATHPAVGAQATLDGTNDAQWTARLNTLESLADANSVGLVVKSLVAGQPRGWVYAGGGQYTPDKENEAAVSRAVLLAGSQPAGVTFTGVVAGCEWRLGVDRDLDGFRDGDELDGGSDPGDPASTPDPVTAVDNLDQLVSSLWLMGSNPARGESQLGFRLAQDGAAELNVYDVRGRLVRRLVAREHRARGIHTARWNLRGDDGQRVPAGVYYVQMLAGTESATRRLAVMR